MRRNSSICTGCVIYCIAPSFLSCGYEICCIFGMLRLWGQLSWRVSYGLIYSFIAWARIVAQNRPQLFPSVFLIILHSPFHAVKHMHWIYYQVRELLFLILISKKVLTLSLPQMCLSSWRKNVHLWYHHFMFLWPRFCYTVCFHTSSCDPTCVSKFHKTLIIRTWQSCKMMRWN